MTYQSHRTTRTPTDSAMLASTQCTNAHHVGHSAFQEMIIVLHVYFLRIMLAGGKKPCGEKKEYHIIERLNTS
jgi:hypothetical protein